MEIQDMLTQAPVAAFIFLITLVTSLAGLLQDPLLIERFIHQPYRVVHHREYYRVFTSTLVHADFMHLIFNMLTYYFFAFWLERIFVVASGDVLGHLHFAVVYVGSAIIAHAPDIYRHRDNLAYRSLGASGAIAGVLFSFILFYPTATLGVMFIIPMPAWLFAIVYIAFSYWADRRGAGNINHGAHLWGAIGGLVITLLLVPQVWLRWLS